jgi:AhpD family alkylhydroperoxidase
MTTNSTGPRVALVVPGTRPELAEMEARIQAARGRISPLYQVLLNSPAVVEGWEAMLTAIRNKTSISPRHRELVILRVAMLNEAAYEFDAHIPHALKAGVSEQAIEVLRKDGAGPVTGTGLEDIDLQVLALTDTMTRDIKVPDALFNKLEAQFGPSGMVELTATVAAYNMVSRFLVAMHIGH